jgi:hypothetical protein
LSHSLTCDYLLEFRDPHKRQEDFMRKLPTADIRLSGRVLIMAAAVAAVAGAALALGTLPPRKPGLWVSNTVVQITRKGAAASPQNAPVVDAICEDAATNEIETKIIAGGIIPGTCPADIQGSGNTYVISSSCASPGGGITVSHTTATWKSEMEIHSESKVTAPAYSSSVVQDSKWVGVCPAGVASGDEGSYVDGVFKKRGNLRDLIPSKAPVKGQH